MMANVNGRLLFINRRALKSSNVSKWPIYTVGHLNPTVSFLFTDLLSLQNFGKFHG